jgi:general secretion pathway protein I
MSKNKMRAENKSLVAEKTVAAFTLIEVIAALVIVSISLLALLRLHLISINMVDTVRVTSQAVFLADEKISELLARGYPENGADSGIVETDGSTLHWQTEVAELRLPKLDEMGIGGLRQISVDVSWKQGFGRKHLQMSTFAADGRLQ